MAQNPREKGVAHQAGASVKAFNDRAPLQTFRRLFNTKYQAHARGIPDMSTIGHQARPSLRGLANV